MKNNRLKNRFTLIVAPLMLLVAFVLYNQMAQANPPKLMFVDLLYLQPGIDESDVEEYFKRITPIVEKHGLKRVGGFKVTKTMKGNIEPNFINLWVVSGPHTFDRIFKDKAYLKNVPFRNKIFDMKRANMFMLSPTFTTVQYPRV